MNNEEKNPTGAADASGENKIANEASEKKLNVENLNSDESKRSDETKRSAPSKPQAEAINFDRIVDETREQVSKAADAFSRGDFLQEEALDPGAGNDDRLVAALCYFVPGLMSLLVLFSDSGNKRPFQRYHAVQGLGLSAALVAISLAYSIISAIAWAVPIIGWLVGVVLFCLAPIAFLMAVIAYLYYGYQAYLGKRFAIPGLTSYLRDQGWL